MDMVVKVEVNSPSGAKTVAGTLQSCMATGAMSEEKQV